MKTEFLKTLGLEQDAIDKIMAEHGKTIEKQKTQVADITGERDKLKTQLEEVSKTLETFKDVDPEALKKEIETLKGDIIAKEADFSAQLSERDFQAAISAEVAASKGKNTKAILALLDVEKLKSSKNQQADIADALKALRESDAYLFEPDDKAGDSKQQNQTPAQVSTGGKHNEDGGAGPPDTSAMMNAQIRGEGD